MRRVVLVGGGHAHALVLRAWALKPRSDVRLTLISPARHTPYSGMLPGHLAGHYGWSEFHIDLATLARAAGAELILDLCIGLDLQHRRVLLANQPAVAFDLVALDTGSTSALRGAGDRLHPVKPVAPFLDAWNAFLQAGPPPASNVVVLGGGVGGVELALAMAHRLGSRSAVTLVERGDNITRDLPSEARARLRRTLNRRGISLRTGAEVTGFDGEAVWLGAACVPSDFTVAAVGATPASWLKETALALTADGFVRVGSDLRAINDRCVFAVGDVAHLDPSPRPKAGVFAVRQGSILDRALRAALDGRPGPTYRPQRDYLRLVSLGDRRALAVRSGLVVGGSGPVGSAVWSLKDRIDRSFMAKLRASRPQTSS